MGGIITNPPPPTEALDYPPENNFDVQAFTGQITQMLQDKGILPKDRKDAGAMLANPLMTLLTWFSSRGAAPIILMLFKQLLEQGEPMAKQLLQLVGAFMKPVMAVLGDLTSLYVNELVGRLGENQRGDASNPKPKLESVAAGVFDSILAPLSGIYGATNPSAAGAGEANSQFALGSITSIHLATWAINILSNITGLGTLKFINSFDEAITGAINSRAIGRIAMKPYLTKFMADPLERDLNKRLPLDSGSPSSLLKSYIRGSLTRAQLIDKMRGKGYAEDVTEQLLLDTARLLSVEEMVWLVNRGAWTPQMAYDMLEQQGCPAPYAAAVFQYAQSGSQRTVWRGIASDLVTAVGNHQIDNPTARQILANSELTEDEVNAYMLRAALQAETPRRLSYSQVKQLYAESLVDLDYVTRFLQAEQYNPEDVELLVLLEFTKIEERKQRALDLAEKRRVAAEEARQAGILTDLRQAAEAAKFKIPWPPP
jgi:hypothetical protein